MILNKKILKQKKYAQLHRYLIAFLLVYLMERYAQSESSSYIRAFAVIIPVFVVDVILSVKDYMNRRSVVYLLRFAEISAAAGCVLMATIPYNMSLAMLILLLFFCEYVLAFDFEEGYYRTLAILTGSIPMIVLLVADMIINRQIKERLFPIACVFLLLIALVTFVISLYAKVVNNYDAQVFGQGRVIDEMSQTNEELRQNQEKVKKSNELLAMQKVKLEQAYKDINSINNEMVIQNEIIKYISSSLYI
uniref:hypothetical protein n=1 Tax=Anaerosporobacter sp. TaxID=1872529 RepID=UPI00286EDCC1